MISTLPTKVKNCKTGFIWVLTGLWCCSKPHMQSFYTAMEKFIEIIGDKCIIYKNYSAITIKYVGKSCYFTVCCFLVGLFYRCVIL